MQRRHATTHPDDQLGAAEALLRERGILPQNGRYTHDQLARELARRGWRLQTGNGTTEAARAFPTTGPLSRSITSSHENPVAALVEVLSDAILDDEAHGLGPARWLRPDIVVRLPDQRIIALAEIKPGQDRTEAEMVDLRRRLVGDSRFYALAPFFLVVTAQAGYLWDQRASPAPVSPPDRTFSMAPVINHYLRWLERDERPGRSALTFALERWLTALAHRDPRRPAAADQAFAGTEFLDAICGASVEIEIPD